MTRYCLVLWLLVGAAGTLRGVDFGAATNPTSGWIPNVLFVGNSFTHGEFPLVRRYNATAVVDENFGLPGTNPRAEAITPGPYGGIPGIFKMLADEAGWPCDVQIEAVSAQTLAFHFQHALPVSAQRCWDAVVLQEYSTGSLPVRRHGNPERFFTYATLLEQAVHAFSPRARVFLYETWPRADLTYRPGQLYSGERIETMATDLHDVFAREISRDARIEGIAPVGDAWVRAIHAGVALANPYVLRKAGKINLWGPDSYHPSAHGAYLAALVLFQRVAGVDARRFGANEQAARDLGVSPTEAVDLQRIASEQIAESATK